MTGTRLLWLASAVVLASAASRAEAQAPVWHPLKDDRAVLRRATGSERVSIGGGDVILPDDAVLCFRVRHGVAVRGEGAEHELGLGYGEARGDFAVSWERRVSRKTVLVMSATGGAQWVCARGAGEVHFDSSLPTYDSMARQRFRERLAGWIWDGDAEPESHTPGERTLLRLAAEGRAIFGEARATAWKRWVWSSAEEVAIADADLASPWWRGTELAAREIEVRAGTPLEVPFGRADLASIALRGASGVRTHVEVFRGASRVAAFDWTGGERGRHGYADTRRWLRVARRGQAPLRVVVTGGRAKLVWRAYERVKTSTEWLDPLAPNQHALGRDAVSEMVALVDGSRAADARTATLLSDPSVPAREKALLAAAVLESAAPDAPMASRAAALVAADRSLEPFPALWLRAVDALRRSGQEVPRDCGRRGGGSDPSSTAARALLHSMTCTGDSRPAATAALESIVQKRPSEARWVKLAAYTSRREVGWVDASPVREVPVVETYAQVDDGAPDGLCRARGAHGTRWRVLAAGDHAFTMSTSSYLHVRVRDRATDWEGTVELDGAPVSVHGAAGIESRVGLDAGTHVLRISGDAPPLLVRWPSSERAECATLRDRARLYPLEGELAFRLGGEGAPTVARIEVLRAHGAPLPTELELRAGDVTRAVNVFAKGIARVEIPIGPTTSELSIRAPNGRGYVRVRYRVRADDADDDDLIELLPRRDAESWLADVERLSMRIAVARAGASDEDPNALLVERARALLALGYRWFAFRDWTLAGRDEVSFESLRAPRDEVRRLDAAARIPPFEEFDANELRIAREAVAHGEWQTRGSAVHVAPAEGGPLALLGAAMWKRSRAYRRAAEAWETVGHPAADLEAARLWADLAEKGGGADGEGDEALLIRALRLAVRASHHPEATELAQEYVERYAAKLDWIRAASVDESGGTRVLTEPSTRDEAEIARVRVRAALSGAPDGAVKLFEGESLRIATVGPETHLGITGGCTSDDPRVSCALRVRVDGAELTTFDARADITVPAGTHTLEVETTTWGNAWVRFDSNASLRTPSVGRRWFLATPTRPIRVSSVGPTVARLDVRAPGEARWEASFDDGPTVEGGGAGDHTLWIAKAETGTTTLTLRPTAPVYVRVSFASARKFGAKTVRVGTPALEPAPSSELALYDGPMAFIRNAREPWPFSWGLNLGVVGVDTRDLDVGASGAPYFEVNPFIATSFGDGPVYLLGSAFVRARSGPSSYGGRIRVELPGHGLLPRLTLRTAIAAQELVEQTFVGFSAKGGATWRIALDPMLSLYPSLSLRWVGVGDVPAGVLHVDPDVYTYFDSLEPWSATAELIAYTRPFVDLASRIRARVVTLPETNDVDRMEFGVSLDVVPGSGLTPWVSLAYLASYRFQTDLRNDTFLRHSLSANAMAWNWGFGQNRVALLFTSRWIPDIQLVEWGLTLSYLGARHRGVDDIPRADVEHRDRMNEGAEEADTLSNRKWGFVGRVSGD